MSGILDFWYAIPLIVAICLVYAATRHEDMGAILRHAVRFGASIVLFMAVLLVVFAASLYFWAV